MADINLKGIKVKHKIVDLGTDISDALPGELFLSAVPGTKEGEAYYDHATGKLVTPPAAYVMRVGDAADDGTTGWLHAPASDVYEWAKNPKITDVDEFAALQEIVDGLTGTGTGGTGTGTSIAKQIEQAKAINTQENQQYNGKRGKRVFLFCYFLCHKNTSP